MGTSNGPLQHKWTLGQQKLTKELNFLQRLIYVTSQIHNPLWIYVPCYSLVVWWWHQPDVSHMLIMYIDHNSVCLQLVNNESPTKREKGTAQKLHPVWWGLDLILGLVYGKPDAVSWWTILQVFYFFLIIGRESNVEDRYFQNSKYVSHISVRKFENEPDKDNLCD